MAIDINSLRKVKADKPPILLIYGPEKMGKTTLSAEFPAPVFIQTEDGASGQLELTTFGLMETFGDVLDALTVLATENVPFKTVVIDSISKLEKLVFAEVCRRHNWSSIEQPGYGKGYAETDYVWGELIEACRFLRDSLGMTVILIGHAVTERFDDPETQSYSRYAIDLHKRALAILKREVDAILLIKKDVTIKLEGPNAKKGDGRARADGGDMRWIYAEGRPAFDAGNRFDMPPRVPFERGKGFTALSPYLPIHQAEVVETPAKKKAA
ncbi:MAG TPA: ATP-binding protein [Caulobacteraceae bacterium]|jgi:hypothetical protein|nr:ATP-binding protein [Caulobacteraceae bacterium]